MLEPPKDVPADVLFRRLCELPRPTEALSHRLPGAEHLPLRVQALTAEEFSRTGAEVASLALLVGTQRAFRSADDVRAVLSIRELGKLLEAITMALGRCSPVDGSSNWRAWQARLLEGARHVTNRRRAYALGSQVDVIGQQLLVDRPERFFGVPPLELIDAHWFAYRAARAFFFECQNARR